MKSKKFLKKYWIGVLVLIIVMLIAIQFFYQSPYQPPIHSEINETFTVYIQFQEQPQTITVYGVSIPLDESEATRVFEKIMGSKPSCHVGGKKQECPITKTDSGWTIVTGALYLADIYVTINDVNRTVHVIGGY